MDNAYKHQIDALVRAREDNLALFHDCGTGKTFTGLHIIKHWLAKEGRPALVVCPLSIIEDVWLADCKKFTPYMSIISLHDTNPAKRLKALDAEHDIYVANYETLKSLYTTIVDKKFGTIIVDESSVMKNPKSQITRALLSFAGITFRNSPYQTSNIIPHRYVGSGTPAPNNEDEYWAQAKFITGPGNEVFNDNYVAHCNHFFQNVSKEKTYQILKFKLLRGQVREFADLALSLQLTPKERSFLSALRTLDLSDLSDKQKFWLYSIYDKYYHQLQGRFTVRNKLHDEFISKLATISHVVRKEDVLDLPPKVHQVRKIFLSQPERTAYNTMKNDLVLQFKDETILSVNQLAEIMKLRQLTSGFIYGEEETHRIGKSKLIELKNLLDELGNHQVGIWINFDEERELLLKELGI